MEVDEKPRRDWRGGVICMSLGMHDDVNLIAQASRPTCAPRPHSEFNTYIHQNGQERRPRRCESILFSRV